jgi:hypothetical protein
VSDVQARLLASGLGLIAGAILCLEPQHVGLGRGIVLIASVLFVVEYIRSQLPDGRTRAEPPATPDSPPRT